MRLSTLNGVKPNARYVYHTFRILLLFLLPLVASVNAISQTTSQEAFETETDGSTSFTDNGQVFKITSYTGKFSIHTGPLGDGWNGNSFDAKCIDNNSELAENCRFAISSDDGKRFKLSRIWLFLSNEHREPLSNGTVTITAKLQGDTVFSSTRTGGFNTEQFDNGYTLFDMTNLAGSNVSGAEIDSYEIRTTGGFTYLRLDAMTWTSVCTPITQAAPTIKHVSCNGGSNGSIVLSTSGTPGLSYDWSGSYTGVGTASISGIPAGDYSCVVSNGCGQSTTVNVTITDPAPLVITAQAIEPISCDGLNYGSISVNVSGGNPYYLYEWLPSGGTSSTASSRDAGNYTVRVTDAGNCRTEKTFTLSREVSAVQVNAAITDVSCFGGNDGALIPEASGGAAPYSYVWNNGSAIKDQVGLEAGTQSVQVKDARGCTGSGSFMVKQPAEPVVTAVWAPANGTYVYGDPLFFTIWFSEPVFVNTSGPKPVLALTLQTGNVTAAYSGGSGNSSLTFKYTIGQADQARNGIVINNLQLNGGTIKTATGCNVTTTLHDVDPATGVIIHNQVAQSILFTPITNIIFGDADIDPAVSASSGLPVELHSSNESVIEIRAGKLHIAGAGSAVITASQAGDGDYFEAPSVQYTFTVQPKRISVKAIANAKTYGDADPVYDYTFTPALVGQDAFSGTLDRTSGQDAGAYLITSGNLQLSNNYRLNFTGANFVIHKAILSVTAGDIRICLNDAFPVIPVSYTGFKNGENTSVLTTHPQVDKPPYNTAGNYPLVPSGGASNNYTFTYVNGSLTVHAVPSGTITVKETSSGMVAGYQLTAPPGHSYRWSNGETTSSILVRSGSNYSVKVSTSEGCSATFSTQVSFSAISIPNTFSPNGDGINDHWTVPALKDFPNAYVVVVNRDGQLVFETRGPFRWDGRRKGELLPAGVYYYRIRKDPGAAVVTGWLNLLR